MKSSLEKRKNENIEKLKSLCEQLNTRDDQIKRDLKMFEGFFANFPIPVTMWSIGKNHAVLAKWGNAFTCNEPKNLEEMFECSLLRDESVKKHEEALSGNQVTYFIEHENKIFWCKLVPREDITQATVGVLGMAWDVTSNAIMVHCLEKTLELLETDCDVGMIKSEISKALNASRLKKMLDERE